MNWPEQKVVVRLTAQRATNIRKAFKSAIDGDEIARQWAETHPAGGSVSPQTARDWTLAQAVVNEKPLYHALSRVYADGYTLGAKVAETRLNGLKKDASVGVVNWSNWKPGNESAAALVRPRGGLKQLLDSRKITVANEITRTKLDRIGTALARSLSKGETAKETAKAINAIIADPQHALTIAQTEMSRAMSVASRDEYEKADVEMVEWLVAEGCEDCQENADASPIGIGDTFPTGDSEPPAHPNCMCALAPYYDYTERDTPEQDNSDLFEFAEEAQALAEEMMQASEAEEVVEEPAVAEPQYPSNLTENELLNIIRDTPEVGMNNEDLWLNAIQEQMGFNALPQNLETPEQLKALWKEGWTRVYRGISRGGKADKDFAKKAAQEFKTGKNYSGNGIYGNGTYTTTSLATAREYAKGQRGTSGSAKTGAILNIAINPSARIIDAVELDGLVKSNLKDMAKARGFADTKTFMLKDRDTYTMFSDLGRFAASKGYDAISVKQGKDEVYYVVLNRGKVAVWS